MHSKVGPHILLFSPWLGSESRGPAGEFPKKSPLEWLQTWFFWVSWCRVSQVQSVTCTSQCTCQRKQLHGEFHPNLIPQTNQWVLWSNTASLHHRPGPHTYQKVLQPSRGKSNIPHQTHPSSGFCTPIFFSFLSKVTSCQTVVFLLFSISSFWLQSEEEYLGTNIVA